MITPSCRLNGYSVQTVYGPQDLPVWAGRNRLDLNAQWLREYGQASIEVDVAPGAVVPVFYAAPWHQFTTGSIGTTQQSRKGVGCLVSLIAAPVVLLFAVVLLALL